MAVIERHRYPALWLPNVVPDIDVEVNTSHPLAPLALYLPGTAFVGADLCGVFPTLKFSPGTTFRSDPSGSSLGSYPANSGGYATGLNSAQEITGSVTLFWRGLLAGAPVGTSTVNLIGLVPHNNTSPYASYNLVSTNTTGRIAGHWNSGGTATALVGTAASAIFNKDISAAIVYPPGGTAVLYINGVQNNTLAFGSASPTYATTYDITVGGVQSTITNRGLNGSTYAAMIFNRALSPAEVMQLHLAPYAMLRPAVRRIRAKVSASVSVSLTGLSATSALGTPAVADTTPVIGLSATSSLGLIGALSIQPLNATSAVAAVALTDTAPLPGFSATAALASQQIALALPGPLTALSANTSFDQPSIVESVILSGLTAASLAGQLDPTDIFLTQSLPASLVLGRPTPSFQISGVAASTTLGSVATIVSDQLASIGTSSALGSLLIAEAFGISGLPASAASGTFVVSLSPVAQLQVISATTGIAGLTISEAAGAISLSLTSAIVAPTPNQATGISNLSAISSFVVAATNETPQIQVLTVASFITILDIVDLSGVYATVFLPPVVPVIEADLVNLSVSSALTPLSLPVAAASVPGLSITSSTGVLTTIDTVSITSLSGSTAFGSLTLGDINLLVGMALSAFLDIADTDTAEFQQISGLNVASTLGTLAVIEGISLTGLTMTTAIGSVSVSASGGVTFSLSALADLSSISPVGTIGQVQALSLTASLSSGVLSVGLVPSLTGLTIVTGFGSESKAETITLTPLSGSLTLGALSQRIVLAAPALTMSTSLGALVQTESISLAVLPTVTNLAPLVPQVSQLFPGLSLTSGIGSSADLITITLGGATATTSFGAITRTGTALGGLSLASGVGQLSTYDALALGTLMASSVLGQAIVYDSIQISGLAVDTAFTPGISIATELTAGISLSTALGQISVAQTDQITSVAATLTLAPLFGITSLIGLTGSLSLASLTVTTSGGTALSGFELSATLASLLPAIDVAQPAEGLSVSFASPNQFYIFAPISSIPAFISLGKLTVLGGSTANEVTYFGTDIGSVLFAPEYVSA